MRKTQATTKQWIKFFYPVHSVDRLQFEKTLKQIQDSPVYTGTRTKETA